MNSGALKIRKILFGIVLATAAAVLVFFLIIFFAALDFAMNGNSIGNYDAMDVVLWIVLIVNLISSVAVCIVSGANRLPMTAGVSCAVMTLIEVIIKIIPIPSSSAAGIYSIVVMILFTAFSIAEIIVGIVSLAKKGPVNNMYGGMYAQQPAQMPMNNGMYGQQPAQMPTNNEMYGNQGSNNSNNSNNMQ